MLVLLMMAVQFMLMVVVQVMEMVVGQSVVKTVVDGASFYVRE